VSLREISGSEIGIHSPTSSGDLIADPAHGLTAAVAREARTAGIKVIFSGQGGDELLGGYRRHSAARLIELLSASPLTASASLLARVLHGQGSRTAEYVQRMGAALSKGDQFAAYMRLCSYSEATDRARILGCYEREVSDDIVWARHRRIFTLMSNDVPLVRRAMALDLNVYLPGLGLSYADRAGMAEGVEIRVPWLDVSFARWTLTLPRRQILTLRKRKIIARERARQVLGRSIAQASKVSFGVPRASLSDASTSGATRQDNYLDNAVRVLAMHADSWFPGHCIPTAAPARAG
jgi:asparagine synthase (glutamine-hydrolysing)